MFRKSLAAVAVLSCVVATNVLAEETSDRVNWLRSHALQLRGIDPQDEDFSDLARLAEWIGNARVVQLGEQSHGDGAAFLAKARLVKFLHQKMGFDVLVWESGLLDCRIAEQALAEKVPALQAARLGVFPIWTMSEQVTPVFNYVQATQGSEKPMTLAGCDCQFSSPTNDRRLSFLADFFDRVDKSILTEERRQQLTDLIAELNSGQGGKEGPPKSLDTVGQLIAIVDQRAEDFHKVHGKGETELISRCLQNLITYESMRRDTDNRPEGNNRRDLAMGQNLVWLANEYFAGRKLIVWAASFHLMHDAPGIKSVGPGIKYDKTVPMGHVVHQALGTNVYTIAFLAHSGKPGNVFHGSWNLKNPPPGSLDDLLHRADFKQAIVDLRSLPQSDGGAWLNEELIARPLGYSPMKAHWPHHFDAFYFTDVMTPSTNPALQARRQQQGKPPLKPEVAQQVKAIAGGDNRPLTAALATEPPALTDLGLGLVQELKEEAIPILIGVIDADNSYESIYKLGYFALRDITGVDYSPFHDGAWWRRWWAANQQRFDEAARKRPIPELAKNAHGRRHRAFAENIDTLEGQLALCGEVLESVDARRAGTVAGLPRISATEFGSELARHNDPRAIPSLIGMIEADNSYDTVYFLGGFGLRPLTGVQYSKFHDGPWWRRWWSEHKQQFPAEVQGIEIPTFPKTKHGKTYRPFPVDASTLAGKLRMLEQSMKAFRSKGQAIGQQLDWRSLPDEIAKHDDPHAIPYLIGALSVDATKDTRYYVCYYGLRPLTGVKYVDTQDFAWWKDWWEKHRQDFPAEVQAIPIPDFQTPLDLSHLSNTAKATPKGD